MAEELGNIDLTVGADEASFESSGKAAGEVMSDLIKGAGGDMAEKIRKALGESEQRALRSSLEKQFEGLRPKEPEEKPGFLTGAVVGRGLAKGAGRISPLAGGVARAGVGLAGIAGGGIALPIIAGVAIAGIALIAFAVSVKKTLDFVNRERSRLQGLSGDIALASVTQNVGQLMRDIERAQALGPQILRITRLTEKLSNAVSPLINTLAGSALLAVEGFLEILNTVTGFLAGILADIAEFIADKASFFFPSFGQAFEFGLNKLAKDLRKIKDGLQEDRDTQEGIAAINRRFAEQLATLAGGQGQVFGTPNQIIPGAFP